MAGLLPFSKRGLPAPFLITPQTTEEAITGKATLIAAGDLAVIIEGVRTIAPERHDLVEKFERLKDD